MQAFCALFTCLSLLHAPVTPEERGHSIGKVSSHANLIVIELDEGALGRENLFDLRGRTLRFVPDGSRYRIESEDLRWDTDVGPEVTKAEVTIYQFSFPFSGKQWKSFLVGNTGSIRFGMAEAETKLDPYGKKDGGIPFERFDQLGKAASKLKDSAPVICAFFKPRLFGPHHVSERPDRVVITWDLAEPFGNLIDFTWFKTSNQFQAALYRDRRIEIAYKKLSGKDAIVGIFPLASGRGKPPSANTAKEVHFSSLTRADGPFTTVYEAFHYPASPRPQDLSCTVMKALGDKFDFLACYSDFRIDSQEASSPSEGPLGGDVTGIGKTDPQDLQSFGTQGRLQLAYAQPVFVGANEMQEWPPDDAPAGTPQDITFYRPQLARGKPRPYNYAISHLGHEVGHRWAGYASAKIKGKMIALGPIHGARGLHAPVAFPFQRPTEASTMGGGVWQDNFDGT